MRPTWQQKKAGYDCEAFIIKKNMKLSARIAFLSLLHGASCIAVADQAFGQSRIYGPVTNVENPNSFIIYQQPSGSLNPNATAEVADARGDYAMAIGAGATAYAIEALAIGHQTEARTTPSAPTVPADVAGKAIAIGARTAAYDTGIAIGVSSVAGGGEDLIQYRTSAIAIGVQTSARTTESIAIGTFASVTEEKALGQNADRSIAIGRSAQIAGSQNSVAIGPAATVLGNSPSSIALGFGALVQKGSESGIAIGTDAIALSGESAIAIGKNSSSEGLGSTAIGFFSKAENGSLAMGTLAVADGKSSIALGEFSLATGGQGSIAIGEGANARNTNATAIGRNSLSTFLNSTALGAGAITTRNNQVVIGTQQDDVTMPGLSGSGTDLVAANNDGTLQRSSVSLQQVDQAVNTTIPKLESAVSGLGQAVESVGAIASAMSAVPQVSLMEDEPMRCGVGTGGYGSEYAISAGCAVRIADRLHLNGALAYAPSVNYQYGSTPSVAGRLGFSFPLGRIAKPSSKPTAEASKELSNVQGTIQKIQAEVKSRDNQIAILKTQLDKLLKAQHSETSTPSSKATTELIATFMSRIEQLENRLAEQELISQRAMEQLKSLVGSAPLGMGAISKVNR